MRIEQRWAGKIVTLSVRGTLNTWGAEVLRETVDELLARGRRDFVLDCERVRHVNQHGLDALVYCVQTVRRAGGDLKLAAISRRLSALFTTSGLLRVFDVYDSVADAIDAFEQVERQASLASGMPRWGFGAALRTHMAEADSVPLG